MKIRNVQEIGDGRIVIDGETYVNEKSSRVIPIERVNSNETDLKAYFDKIKMSSIPEEEQKNRFMWFKYGVNYILNRI